MILNPFLALPLIYVVNTIYSYPQSLHKMINTMSICTLYIVFIKIFLLLELVTEANLTIVSFHGLNLQSIHVL